jgi:hypothetical protein
VSGPSPKTCTRRTWLRFGIRGSRLSLRANFYDTAFCTTNVHIHSVAAAVEMQDGTTAVAGMRVTRLPPQMMRSRVAHHNIDLSRGFTAWMGITGW